ncbi:MAG: IPT/TIG domain-containing protein [Myxococcota bacterium]
MPITVTSVAPLTGFVAGGLTITITGSGFADGLTVSFDGEPCLSVVVLNDTTATCVTPVFAAGAVDVAVSLGAETVRAPENFIYKDFTQVSLLAGTDTPGFADGAGDLAQFSEAINDFLLVGQDLVVTDGNNYRLRVVDLSGFQEPIIPSAFNVTTLAGNGAFGLVDSTDGTGGTASFVQPDDLELQGDLLVVTDVNWANPTGGAVRTVSLLTGETTSEIDIVGYAGGALQFVDGVLYMSECGEAHRVVTVDLLLRTLSTFSGGPELGDAVGDAATTRFNCPYGLIPSLDGSALVVSDTLNNKLKVLQPSDGSSTLLAGEGTQGVVDGPAATAQFSYPSKMTQLGNGYLVADWTGCVLRHVNATTGETTTFAGNSQECGADNGPLSSARFHQIGGVLYAPAYGIFVAPTNYGWATVPTGAGQIRLIH